MSDLRELYQEVILDHHKKPRNFRKLEDARHVEGYNPLCGDKVTVYVKLDGEIVRDVSFQGTGCAISTASASMMTESLKGKTRAEAEGKLQRAKLTSTQLPTYYVGINEWWELRHKYEEAKGKDFNLMEFHNQALDQGPLPVPVLEKILLGRSGK